MQQRNKQQQIIWNFCNTVQIFLQTSVAAPSHQELKVCEQFGDWIRNDIQYCSFQARKISKIFFMKAWQYFLGLWSDLCSLCKISILKENLESFIPILQHTFQFTSPKSSASATPRIMIAIINTRTITPEKENMRCTQVEIRIMGAKISYNDDAQTIVSVDWNQIWCIRLLKSKPLVITCKHWSKILIISKLNKSISILSILLY